MPQPLSGVFVASITPRRAGQHGIDLGATLELVDFLCAAGVDGIALLGSTGEFVHFSIDDRMHMVNLVAKRSQVPLLVNVSHSTLDGAVELARGAGSAGVAGVLVMPPYYFRQSQPAVDSFFRKFAGEIGKAAPIYLYNMPACTTELSTGVAAELLGSGLFAGIKDSSGSLDYFRALQEQSAKTPVTLFAGHEKIYAQCKAIGAKGVVSGVASALPELIVAVDRAINAGDTVNGAKFEALLTEFLQHVEPFPWPAAVKQAAKQRKLKPGALASPLGPEGERQLAAFGEWFDGWLPGVLRTCGL